MIPKGTAVLVDGQYQATVLADYGKSTVLIEHGKNSYWMQRSRLALPADYLAANEAPAPANRQYFGVMAERLEKRGGR